MPCRCSVRWASGWRSRAETLPKSPVGQAISYARNQWNNLQTYACDGEMSIDNNVSERSVRAQAIGRKNYLFVGSDRGGRTAATLYSLVGTCKRLQIDPYAYVKDVLERLPAHPADRLGELLHELWIAANPQARIKVASKRNAKDCRGISGTWSSSNRAVRWWDRVTRPGGWIRDASWPFSLAAGMDWRYRTNWIENEIPRIGCSSLPGVRQIVQRN